MSLQSRRKNRAARNAADKIGSIFLTQKTWLAVRIADSADRVS
jgi:hypothetical protein